MQLRDINNTTIYFGQPKSSLNEDTTSRIVNESLYSLNTLVQIKRCNELFLEFMYGLNRLLFKTKLKTKTIVLKNIAGSRSCLRNVKKNYFSAGDCSL